MAPLLTACGLLFPAGNLSVVLTLKQLKNETSIWGCADAAVIAGLKGKWFKPENWLPDRDGRHQSHWGDGGRVRRGWRRGSPWGKASAALQWHQGIGDIILLLYTALCNGLAKLRAGLPGLSRPSEPQRRQHRNTISFEFTHHTGSDTLFSAKFFIEWMVAAGSFMISFTGIAAEAMLTMSYETLHHIIHQCIFKAATCSKAVLRCCSRHV